MEGETESWTEMPGGTFKGFNEDPEFIGHFD
jgi:hypothetical protein